MTHRHCCLFLITTILCASGCAVAVEGYGEFEENTPETLRFKIGQEDAGAEGFYCFNFNRPQFAGRILRDVRVEPPEDPALQLHHANLYAIRDSPDDDDQNCMIHSELATSIHVWTPGVEQFELPPDVGLKIPPDTVRFSIHVHTLRFAEGPRQYAKMTLDFYETPPPQMAARLPIWVHVPTIEAHATATSTRVCKVSEPMRAIGVWPHMHKAGTEFRGEIIRPNGERETAIHLDPWNFTEQLIHPISLELAAGDKIETRCTWENTTPNPIKAGPLSTDEMCEQTFIVWPAEAAKCQ